jgi:hypothetical protein
MERYIYNANMAHYRHLIAESERDPKRDEDRHKNLLTLLAEEIAKQGEEAVRLALADANGPPRCAL